MTGVQQIPIPIISLEPKHHPIATYTRVAFFNPSAAVADAAVAAVAATAARFLLRFPSLHTHSDICVNFHVLLNVPLPLPLPLLLLPSLFLFISFSFNLIYLGTYRRVRACVYVCLCVYVCVSRVWERSLPSSLFLLLLRFFSFCVSILTIRIHTRSTFILGPFLCLISTVCRVVGRTAMCEWVQIFLHLVRIFLANIISSLGDVWLWLHRWLCMCACEYVCSTSLERIDAHIFVPFSDSKVKRKNFFYLSRIDGCLFSDAAVVWLDKCANSRSHHHHNCSRNAEASVKYVAFIFLAGG